MSGRGQSQANNDNKSGQCNPNNPEYKGYTSGYSGTGTKADRDNHGNQLNPNNERYQPKKWFRGNKPEGILTWKQNWFFYYVNIKKPKSFFLLLFYGNKSFKHVSYESGGHQTSWVSRIKVISWGTRYLVESNMFQENW